MMQAVWLVMIMMVLLMMVCLNKNEFSSGCFKSQYDTMKIQVDVSTATAFVDGSHRMGDISLWVQSCSINPHT